MHESAQLNDGFLSAAPYAIVVSDEGGRIIQANPAAERLLGYGAGELLGLGIEQLVPAPARAKHEETRLAHVPGAAGRAHDSSRQLDAVCKDGREIPVVIGLAPWDTPAGMRHVSFIIDDAARRHAELQAHDERRAAIEAAELSQAVVRAASLGVMLFDAQSGKCVSGNEAAAAMMGVPQQDLIDRSFRGLDTWRSCGLLAAAESALASHSSVTREVEMPDANGRRRALRCECTTLTLRDRPHLAVLFTDVTERRDLEAQLLVAQKMEAIGQLAGGVAHDFNNLLTVIGTYSSLLIEEFSRDDPRRADLEEIQSAAKRAAGLTGQLLAFGRRQASNAGPVELNSIIDGLEKMLRRVLPAEISLRILRGQVPGAIHADAGQIEQALMNLVVNARDAMPHGGELTIETSVVDARGGAGQAGGQAPGEMVVLRVSDTGHGMDEATASRAFEPFFTTKEPGRGTGLGLSTTYGIVKQSGGFVRLSSTPGNGTVFELHFPLASGRDASGQDASPPEALEASGTGDILVVEDDEHVRRIVVTTLRGRGYTVTEATNGEEALQVALKRSAAPDLLVTDMVMPRMNGKDLAARLRHQWPGLRVLFTTAYAVDEQTDRSAADLPGALLRKPFVPADLARAVQMAMRIPKR